MQVTVQWPQGTVIFFFVAGEVVRAVGTGAWNTLEGVGEGILSGVQDIWRMMFPGQQPIGDLGAGGPVTWGFI